MFSIDFDTLRKEAAERLSLDLYNIEYPKVEIDDALGQKLHQHFMTILLMSQGTTSANIAEFWEKNSANGWTEQNTGRNFNFWHYCYDLMKDTMETTSSYHSGSCVIRRGMKVDKESSQGFMDDKLIQTFCYPYVAKGDEFATPVINKILNHFSVEEMEITAKIGR